MVVERRGWNRSHEMENFAVLWRSRMWTHTFSLSYQLQMTAEPEDFGLAQHEYSCPTSGFTAAGTMVSRSNTRHVKVPPEEQGVWCSYLWLLPTVRHRPASSDQRDTDQGGGRAFLYLLETYRTVTTSWRVPQKLCMLAGDVCTVMLLAPGALPMHISDRAKGTP